MRTVLNAPLVWQLIAGVALSDAERGDTEPTMHHPRDYRIAPPEGAGEDDEATPVIVIVGLGLGVLSAMGAERDELARIVDDCVAALEAERKRQGGTPTD